MVTTALGRPSALTPAPASGRRVNPSRSGSNRTCMHTSAKSSDFSKLGLILHTVLPCWLVTWSVALAPDLVTNAPLTASTCGVTVRLELMLKVPRRLHGVAELHDRVYAFGGVGADSEFQTLKV